MRTLIDIGKRCMVYDMKKQAGQTRLVVCPKCKTRNICKVTEHKQYVQCLGCPRLIELSEEGNDGTTESADST